MILAEIEEGSSNVCFIVGLCAAFLIMIVVRIAKASARSSARSRYEALDALTRNPTNANQRQLTLALGREYSSEMRDKKGHTIFDEIALSNDINAACAGSTIAPISPVEMAASSIENRLKKLELLHEKGLVSQAEYEDRRRSILNEL